MVAVRQAAIVVHSPIIEDRISRLIRLAPAPLNCLKLCPAPVEDKVLVRHVSAMRRCKGTICSSQFTGSANYCAYNVVGAGGTPRIYRIPPHALVFAQ